MIPCAAEYRERPVRPPQQRQIFRQRSCGNRTPGARPTSGRGPPGRIQLQSSPGSCLVPRFAPMQVTAPAGPGPGRRMHRGLADCAREDRASLIRVRLGLTTLSAFGGHCDEQRFLWTGTWWWSSGLTLSPHNFGSAPDAFAYGAVPLGAMVASVGSGCRV